MRHSRLRFTLLFAIATFAVGCGGGGDDDNGGTPAPTTGAAYGNATYDNATYQ